MSNIYPEFIKVKMLKTVPICKKFEKEIGNSLFVKDEVYQLPFYYAENWEQKRWCVWL